MPEARATRGAADIAAVGEAARYSDQRGPTFSGPADRETG